MAHQGHPHSTRTDTTLKEEDRLRLVEAVLGGQGDMDQLGRSSLELMKTLLDKSTSKGDKIKHLLEHASPVPLVNAIPAMKQVLGTQKGNRTLANRVVHFEICRFLVGIASDVKRVLKI